MTRKQELAGLVAVSFLGFVCRLQALFQTMRYDESVSWAYSVGRSFGTIASTYKQPNNHVFYSLLAKLCAAPAGYAPWALRLPAFIAGVAIVPLLWLVGSRYADARTALLGAALSAGATPLVLYSTNARGYTLVVAMFLVQLVIAETLQRKPTPLSWVLYAVSGALGLYTIPVMLYPFGISALWLAMSARHLAAPARRRMWRGLALACVAAVAMAGAAYLPIIMHAGLSALSGNKFVEPSPWSTFVLEAGPMMVVTVESWTSPLPTIVVPVLVLLALAGLNRRPSADHASLTLAAVLWCGLVLVVTHRAPFERVWLFLLPLFLLAVARGVWRATDRLFSPSTSRQLYVTISVALLVVAGEMLTHAAERSPDTGVFRPAEQVSELLAGRLRPTDRVLAPIPAIGPLLYYFPRVGADTALLTVSEEHVQRVFLVLSTPDAQSIQWAVRMNILDTARYVPPKRIAQYAEGEVWEAVRR